MAFSPALIADLAAATRTLYEDAELVLIEQLREAIAQGLEAPAWATIKARSAGHLRAAVEEITAVLERDADGAVARALMEAYERGRQAAVAELSDLDAGGQLQGRRVLPNAPAVDRLAASSTVPAARGSRPPTRRWPCGPLAPGN
ncbi:hypothetical protein [Streptomyces sp. ODS28]|uniref:hypothetical protein n=1 Tax=Streptomyces sp. ODS28 TaxID=3136688 RepID=UPI0031F07CDE